MMRSSKKLMFYNNFRNMDKFNLYLRPRYSINLESSFEEKPEMTLMYPNIGFLANRANSITLSFFTSKGEPESLKIEGEKAIFYQSAIDGLSGLDPLSPMVCKGSLFVAEEVREMKYFDKIHQLISEYNLACKEYLNSYELADRCVQTIQNEPITGEYEEAMFNAENKDNLLVDFEDHQSITFREALNKNKEFKAAHQEKIKDCKELAQRIRLLLYFAAVQIVFCRVIYSKKT